MSGIDSPLGSASADASEALNRARAFRAALDLAAQGGSPADVAATRRSYRDGEVAARPAAAAAGDAGDAGDSGDDLTKVEGVGPKIAELLQAAGIRTYADLAAASQDTLKQVLADAGARYAAHDPGTWSEQAALAASGDWDTLKTLQDQLDGGRRVS
ncbi:MAG: helix-hairpin-helix domain-containing protein [Burkholderiaceae bacterium]